VRRGWQRMRVPDLFKEPDSLGVVILWNNHNPRVDGVDEECWIEYFTHVFTNDCRVGGYRIRVAGKSNMNGSFNLGELGYFLESSDLALFCSLPSREDVVLYLRAVANDIHGSQ